MSIKTINFFGNRIGQRAVLSEINEILTLEKAALENKCKAMALRPLFMAGSAGLGKTEVSKAIGIARESYYGGEHRYVAIPAKSSRGDVIAMLADNVHGRPATIFVDESHELSAGFVSILKPILETGENVEDVRLSKECIFTANPYQHLWIFASNMDCKDEALFGPNSRTDKLSFVAFTESEKRAMLTNACAYHEAKIDADAVEYLCDRSWPTARAVVRELANKIVRKARLSGNKIDLAMAREFCNSKEKENRRYLLGIDHAAMEILLYLNNETKGKQVTEIAMKAGITMKNASYYLHWLGALKLTQTLANGRKALGEEGSNYLKRHADLQKAVAAKKRAAKAATDKAQSSEMPEIETAKG